ncbi:hypothetical protein LguiA_017856 [Lonicera macranthoides]
MDSILYKAAIAGKVDVLIRNQEKIGVQLTPDGKTVLHLASELGQTEAIKVILSMHPSLISQTNLSGETGLHLAARGGHASVVQFLMDSARKLDDEDIESRPHAWELSLWTANDDGETALHEAARYNRREVLSMLVKEDPSYTHSVNKIGETPLYIAASRGFHELVDVILNNCEAPVYSGPNGTTALHGAVICGSEECTRKLLEWKETIVRETDSNGQTPLHYAAYFGFSSIACQLLHVDPSTAYVANKYYSETALHIAAIRGHVVVMKEILLACPDCCSMVNIHGRNMLHLAIENNHKKVIEYIIEECPVIGSLINRKDVDGNAPSHLLELSICNVPKLIQHDMVDKGALINSKNLSHLGSVYNIIRNNTKAETEIEEAPKSCGGALRVHNTMNKGKPTLMQKEAADPTPVHFPVPFQPPARAQTAVAFAPAPAAVFSASAPGPALANVPVEEIRQFINTDIIVAALIVTVAFAAGFTMPGGYIQSGSENQGTAVLAKSVAFQAFVISDTLALLFSLTALFLYSLTAADITQETVIKFYSVGGWFTLLALVVMMIAFITGTYAVLAHSSGLAIATCLLGCAPEQKLERLVLRSQFDKLAL